MYNFTSRYPNRAARFVATLNLTIEDLEALCKAAWNTWNVIGPDIFAANDGKAMSREEVIEVVMDADYILSMTRGLPPAVKAVLQDYTKSAVVQAVLKTFVFLAPRYQQ